MNRLNPLIGIIFSGIAMMGCAAPGGFTLNNAGKPWSISEDKQNPRYGDTCLRFELRHGDYWHYSLPSTGWRKSHRTEKKMLFRASHGEVYWYGFSLMIPVESSDPQAMIKVGQWHQGTDALHSPAAEQEWQGKKLSVRVGWQTKEIEQFEKGKWFDFVYQFKFGSDGFANVWLNGEKFMEFKGSIGTPESRPYFKYGIYSPHFLNKDETLIVFFDEYRRGTGYVEVDPSHGTGPPGSLN